MPLSDRVRRFLADPPAGSKTREALDCGVDITLTTERLSMTPSERLAGLGARMDWFKSLRHARQAIPELEHLLEIQRMRREE
jgi:hypothetical protein